jgi:hypothetical protein
MEEELELLKMNIKGTNLSMYFAHGWVYFIIWNVFGLL